jgi:hypothetical protein
LCIERTEEVSSKSQKSIPFIDDANGKTLVLQKVSLLFWPEAAASKVLKNFSLFMGFIDDRSGEPSGNVPCTKL